MFVWRPKLDFQLASLHAHGLHESPSAASAGGGSFSFVLYVGKAGDGSKGTLKSRYKDEYSSMIGASPDIFWSTDEPSNRKERLRYFLSLEPLEYWFQEFPSNRVGDLETRLIKALNPPANMQGRRRKLKAPEPAFPQN
jgi:hypothetical protein